MSDVPHEFCSACEHAIDGSIRFCGFCGTSVLAIGRHRLLNYDGVYVTARKVEHGLLTRQYLRFYPDRLMVGVTFASRQKGVATWFGRHTGGRMLGVYSIAGREIEMACMGDSGASVFAGRVWKHGLTITSCNGVERQTIFHFIEGRERQRKPERPAVVMLPDRSSRPEVRRLPSIEPSSPSQIWSLVVRNFWNQVQADPVPLENEAAQLGLDPEAVIYRAAFRLNDADPVDALLWVKENYPDLLHFDPDGSAANESLACATLVYLATLI